MVDLSKMLQLARKSRQPNKCIRQTRYDDPAPKHGGVMSKRRVKYAVQPTFLVFSSAHTLSTQVVLVNAKPPPGWTPFFSPPLLTRLAKLDNTVAQKSERPPTFLAFH